MSEPSAGHSRIPAPRRRPSFGFVLSPWFQRGLLAIALASIVSFLMMEYVRGPGDELVVGAIAPRDMRAHQSLEIEDKKATLKRRDQAEGSVRPVYNLDKNLQPDLTGNLRRAFSNARKQIKAAEDRIREERDEGTVKTDPTGDRLEDSAAAHPSEETTSNRVPIGVQQPEISQPTLPLASSPSSSVSPKLSPKATRIASRSDEAGVTPQHASFMNRPGKQRIFSKALGAELLDVFYQNLVFARFDPAIENGTADILGSIMASPIIGSMSSLPENIGLTGLTLIQQGRAGISERMLFDREIIIDLPEARRRAGALVWERYSDRPRFEQDTIVALVEALLRPNLTYNASQTSLRQQRARASVQPVTYQIKKGTMIVRAGDPIDAQQLMYLTALAQAEADYHPVKMFLSVSFFVFLLFGSTYLFAATYIRKFKTDIRDLITMSIILVLVIALTRVTVEIANALAAYIQWIPINSYYFAIPLAAGAMIVRILMNSETALIFAVIVSALAAMLVDYSVFFLAYYFISSIAAAGGIAHTKERVHVLRGGMIAAGCNILLVIAIHLIQTNMIDAGLSVTGTNLSYNLAFAFLAGVGTAVLSLGVVPFFEMFGYVTDYKLLELANLNHPLLKDLMVKAPGTYHHSVIVGTLSEAAAQAIRANALLARVGCYYHDIGKMRKPSYFIENLRDVTRNKHDHLPPHMSALVIAGHVRDGIEMGRRHRLPQSIIDLIPQHHGTALISFFYNKARQSATDNEHIAEHDYRYPGPKPQTREAGIVMLADATEASTRSIKQINGVKIRMNLYKILQRIIRDGQLDECPLTLRDLNVIMDSFHQTLTGIYHNRIEYPAEYQPGAAKPGEGTGAVLTLDPEGSPMPPAESPRVRRETLSVGGLTTTQELMATTTVDPVPGPETTVDAASSIAESSSIAAAVSIAEPSSIAGSIPKAEPSSPPGEAARRTES